MQLWVLSQNIMLELSNTSHLNIRKIFVLSFVIVARQRNVATRGFQDFLPLSCGLELCHRKPIKNKIRSAQSWAFSVPKNVIDVTKLMATWPKTVKTQWFVFIVLSRSIWARVILCTSCVSCKSNRYKMDSNKNILIVSWNINGGVCEKLSLLESLEERFWEAFSSRVAGRAILYQEIFFPVTGLLLYTLPNTLVTVSSAVFCRKNRDRPSGGLALLS